MSSQNAIAAEEQEPTLMIIKKTFEVEMTVNESLSSQKIKSLADSMNAEKIKKLLTADRGREHFQSYKVEEIENETKIAT